MAYAISAVVTGIAFLLLGYFKLGVLVGFFPRHILIGCIGGVGLFLLETGFEVTTHINFRSGLNAIVSLFTHFGLFTRWGSSFSLAIMLRLLERRFHWPLLVPIFFIITPILFFILTWLMGYSLSYLRENNWVFSPPEGANVPWYDFYEKYGISLYCIMT